MLFHNKSSLEISPSVPYKIMNGPVKIDMLVLSALITNQTNKCHPPYQHVMAIFIEVFLLTAIDNYIDDTQRCTALICFLISLTQIVAQDTLHSSHYGKVRELAGVYGFLA